MNAPAISTSFCVPMPPSTNNLFFNVRGRGRVKTPKYRSWQAEAAAKAKYQKARMVMGPIMVMIDVGHPLDKRRRDISNLIKPIEDLMVQNLIIEDDSLIQNLTIRYSRGVAPKLCQVVVMQIIGDAV